MSHTDESIPTGGNYYEVAFPTGQNFLNLYSYNFGQVVRKTPFNSSKTSSPDSSLTNIQTQFEAPIEPITSSRKGILKKDGKYNKATKRVFE